MVEREKREGGRLQLRIPGFVGVRKRNRRGFAMCLIECQLRRER